MSLSPERLCIKSKGENLMSPNEEIILLKVAIIGLCLITLLAISGLLHWKNNAMKIQEQLQQLRQNQSQHTEKN